MHRPSSSVYRLPLVLLCFLAGRLLPAQCPALDLAVFQTLQRAEPEVKEARILEHGFELQYQTTDKGATVRQYRKCWQTNVGSEPVFEQLLRYDCTANTLLFATLNARHFDALKKSIVERSGSASAQQGQDYYIGKMFRYRFDTRAIDGKDYRCISIALR